MKMQVVAVFDCALEAFGRPVFCGSVGVATRSFQDEINRADDANDMYKHAKDFELYSLGAFDDSTGKFELPREPQLLARGKDLLKAEEK